MSLGVLVIHRIERRLVCLRQGASCLIAPYRSFTVEKSVSLDSGLPLSLICLILSSVLLLVTAFSIIVSLSSSCMLNFVFPMVRLISMGIVNLPLSSMLVVSPIPITHTHHSLWVI